LTPPSVCPVATSPDLAIERFDLCTYVPLTGSADLTEGGDSWLITVKFDLEMWAQLQVPAAGEGNSRQWTVDAIIDQISISNPSPYPTLSWYANIRCTDPGCTTQPDDTAAYPTTGTLTPTPIGLQFSADDTANSATVNLNNVFQFAFYPVGAPPCSSCQKPLDYQAFGTVKSDSIRCDSQGGTYNYPAGGCVISAYDPVWYVDDAAFPDMGLTVKHMALATGRLPGYNGLSGAPGWASPLTYAPSKKTANHSAACEGETAPPGEAALGNTTCDEYPLATTAEGAASGGPYSICWVPKDDNSAQGTRNSQFLYDNRVLADDHYYVDALYFGSNPGCNTNLGGGGSVAPDNTLDSMFGSYGDNATCADWSGGDATNSVVLPNGERAWFFSDTYLNSPAERKTLWYSSALHNSIVIQNGSQLTSTITGGNTCQETNMSLSFWSRYAQTPAPAPDAGGAYWTGDQMVVGSNVVKFYYHVGAGFNIDHPAVATIPASSLESPATDASGDPKITITPTQFSCGASSIIWGTALLNWNGNIYVYGWQGNGTRKIYLAKTTTGNLASPATWQLYDGMSGSSPVWGSCSSSAAALPITNGTTGFSVDSVNDNLWLVQFDYTNGQLAAAGPISAHPSATPWGFGNDSVALYNPPTGYVGYPDYYQDYEARIQPSLGAAGQVVISYNVNTSAVDTGCVSANAHDATIYRPRFIDVPVSAFDPSAATAAAGTSTAAARNATARTAAGIPDAADQGFPYGIHDSPPFATTGKLPTPAPAPASATSAPASSASVKAATTSAPAAASTTTDGIDGSDDWFEGPSCPVIPAPADAPSLTVQSTGLVDATWDKTGTDVWYYVWICDQTKNDCSVKGTSSPWVPAWPYQALGGEATYLWTTGAAAELDPIDAVLTETGQNSNGDTFAIYVSPFGAGNSTCSGNSNGCGGSPVASVTVSSP
jgi:hypothetical protein